MSTNRAFVDPAGPVSGARIARTVFGKLPKGGAVEAYTLMNSHSVTCQIITYGSSIAQLHLPDRDGNIADVILGYDCLDDYLQATDYVGATIGRVANRIRNARFRMDGYFCQLTANEGSHHLHGGFRGFDKRLWHVLSASQAEGSLKLAYTSRDGEEGYPGTLRASVRYTLTDQDELWMEYQATTDKPTPVNLTNHTYFNLAGRGAILEHVLTLNADSHTPLDGEHIPIGTIERVTGTRLDFRLPTRIGPCSRKEAKRVCNFNHNYVLNSQGADMAFAARLYEPESGRVVEVWTDQPSIQLYTGSYIQPVPPGKNGVIYGPHSGLCLEPQQFSDAVNHASFPSIILLPGATYRHRTFWRFSVE